jgi:hypothetical protein
MNAPRYPHFLAMAVFGSLLACQSGRSVLSLAVSSDPADLPIVAVDLRVSKHSLLIVERTFPWDPGAGPLGIFLPGEISGPVSVVASGLNADGQMIARGEISPPPIVAPGQVSATTPLILYRTSSGAGAPPDAAVEADAGADAPVPDAPDDRGAPPPDAGPPDRAPGDRAAPPLDSGPPDRAPDDRAAPPLDAGPPDRAPDNQAAPPLDAGPPDRAPDVCAAGCVACGPADAVCPPGCSGALDPDCLLDDGSSCAMGTDCRAGYCIGGVCCNNSCSDRCDSCTTGQCTLAPAGPECVDPIAVILTVL